MLANPPFGVEWKKVERVIRDEHEKLGFSRPLRRRPAPHQRWLSALPPAHDLQDEAPARGGSRLAIVFNGSPLFTGGAGSGRVEIRRWIIENDWLEAVVALPDQLFYNTGISTYFWVVTIASGRAAAGRSSWSTPGTTRTKMRKSLGNKRKSLSEEQIAEVTRLYAGFTEGERVKIFPTRAFGFQRITVERPLRLRYEVSAATLPALAETKAWAKLVATQQAGLKSRLNDLEGASTTDRRAMAKKLGPIPASLEKALWEAVAVTDPEAPVITKRKGEPEPDPDLRDNENVPLPEGGVRWEPDPSDRLASLEYRAAVDDYVAAEVQPYVPDAWVDHTKTRVGYEIPFTRHF